jgi:hypothetical protein
MALVTTVRQTPAGIKLDDGFPTKIAFERDPDVSFWEKSVQPPGFDGGDPIDTTTMHNTSYRTMSSRRLKTMTEATLTVAYDPAVYTQINNNLINQEGSVTVRFPDGSTLDFFGYLQTFEPSEVTEGEQPEAEITIAVTNQDPVTGAETAPVITSVAGT